ncbi:MAG TPA: large conductance mechanosensitive channel protein MscL [Mycobacteriales bacterium]|jgi:large conductance mechanosensitive channel|nr:large conductance mechanosensitive channel protein MscL [Mycobacteriales bacterium]
MLRGFRDFISRGNVIDLAVGVVIGAAFSAVITQLTKSFLQPLITLLTGGAKAGGKFTVNDVDFAYGDFINALVTFLLTAAALYFFVVLPVNTWNARRKRTTEDTPAVKPENIVLLTEIRDALQRR